MEIKERIFQFIDYKGLSVNKVEVEMKWSKKLTRLTERLSTTFLKKRTARDSHQAPPFLG